MKLLIPVSDNIRPKEIIGNKISKHIQGLDRYKKDDKQKILELCQIGKFLGYYFPQYEIIEVREKPDFIISNGSGLTGVEHGMILESKSKSREGFYETISDRIEQNLLEDKSLPNFLVNCFLKKEISYKNRDKNYIIKSLTGLIRDFVLDGNLHENEFVDRIRSMPHTQKNVRFNFGGYVERTITDQLIIDFVNFKEAKAAAYRQSGVDKLWLIILIGGASESSYNVDKPFPVKLNTQFDKVFLFEDFNNIGYELK